MSCKNVIKQNRHRFLDENVYVSYSFIRHFSDGIRICGVSHKWIRDWESAELSSTVPRFGSRFIENLVIDWLYKRHPGVTLPLL